MPNLTISDNGSLFTCRAVQADMGRSVPTTVKLIVEGGDKTQGNHYLNFRLISESEKQQSKFVDASHSNTIETKSNNDASDNHGVEENIQSLKSSSNKNTLKEIKNLSLIHIIIIGVVVVVLLYVVIVIIVIRRRDKKKCYEDTGNIIKNNEVDEKANDLADDLELKVI